MIKRIQAWALQRRKVTIIELTIATGIGAVIGELVWYFFVK